MALVGRVFGGGGQRIFIIAADSDGIGSVGHVAVYIGYARYVGARCIGCTLAGFTVTVTACNYTYHERGEHKFFHTTLFDPTKINN